MSCYHPLKAYRTPDGVVFNQLSRHDIIGDIELPCGQCIGCRLRRAGEWQARCKHEALYWDKASFLTLTYEEEHLPADGGLRHRDFALFMKRVRRMHNPRVRFFMCGEYGSENGRPHYHCVLFGEDFRPWKWVGRSGSGKDFYTNVRLSELWKLGRVTVQPCCGETIGYCTRYIVDKVTGDRAEAHYGGKKPEYCVASQGLGMRYYAQYGETVATQDFVVVDSQERVLPRYYAKMARKDARVDWDAVEQARYVRARAALPDNTDERRAVREIVHKARVRNLKRDL